MYTYVDRRWRRGDRDVRCISTGDRVTEGLLSLSLLKVSNQLIQQNPSFFQNLETYHFYIRFSRIAAYRTITIRRMFNL